jgi:hypothetical protein
MIEHPDNHDVDHDDDAGLVPADDTSDALPGEHGDDAPPPPVDHPAPVPLANELSFPGDAPLAGDAGSSAPGDDVAFGDDKAFEAWLEQSPEDAAPDPEADPLRDELDAPDHVPGLGDVDELIDWALRKRTG